MTMSRTRKTILIISGIVLTLLLVSVIGLALLFYALRNNEPSVANNSVLVLQLSGALPDYVPEDPLANRLFGNDDQSLTSLLTQFRKAKIDKRISAVLLDINSTAAGWAKADELREAIADFRTSNKPVYAFMEVGGNREYYIATACDRIYVAPAGELTINGFAAEATFYRGALDKLGIYLDVYQIGKYKNAPDQFTRKEMSEAQREVINALLDDRFNRFIDTIATARKRSSEDVRTLVDNAPLSARQAQEAGLIDATKYRNEVEDELKQRLGYKDDDKLKRVRAAEYRGVSPESLGLNKGERIAIIYASGNILSGSSGGGGPFGDQTVGSDTVVKAINDARNDKAIRAIVLRVDSPGGSALASDVIWGAVEAAKQRKPVVVSMSDVAASGGYYIATNANRILAQPSTITGSIGVFGGKPVLKGFYDWIGVNNQYVLRGKNAGMLRETEPFTPTERAKYEETIRRIYYDDFLPKVAAGRGRDVEYIHSIAQGRVWSGVQAKERGLVDEFGGLDRAVDVAKQLANISADKGVRRVIFPAPRTLLEQVFGSSDEDTSLAELKIKWQQQAAFNALPEDVRRTLRYAAIFDRMKRGEVMALMPFDLQIK
ncbi:MAG: signal peptide peptidase SppA [Pyrinomonadaceae bacterium]|nr:signal peptide peptidase SppA [Pyrinomonadaceae bacterium]